MSETVENEYPGFPVPANMRGALGTIYQNKSSLFLEKEHPTDPNLKIKALRGFTGGWDFAAIGIFEGENQLTRNPTWEEMSAVKKEIFGDKAAVQFHTDEDLHEEEHPGFLVLWHKR